MWPRPQTLLPPRLLDAFAAAQSGDPERALALVTEADARDPFAADLVGLLRAWSALESPNGTRARRTLGALVERADPALASLAIQVLVDAWARRRRFAPAAALLRRAQSKTHDPVIRMWNEAAALALEVERRGTAPAALVEALALRLERGHPAALHAAVHLLRAEHALLCGDLPVAVAAQRQARPFVRTCAHGALAARLEVLARTLRAPFLEVLDWSTPRRTVTREELAEIEDRPWQLWLDFHHRRVRRRSGRRGAPVELGLAQEGATWEALRALVESPGQRLSWSRLAGACGLGETAAAHARAERVARELRAAALPLRQDADGCRLAAVRWVIVFTRPELPALERTLLAKLALHPGASAAELASEGAARRTVLDHLARLRCAGDVRMVGGGPQARYWLV